ncbi:hypothetical protein LBMAG54_11280 [Nitrosopumilaceae archaeon]|nr:hypothetical protein LBMAG54_11280 [Nitrosopumilaceae archaeon]
MGFRIKVKYTPWQHNEQVNCMNTKILLAASLIAVFTIGYYADNVVAFAQYMGNVGSKGETGTYTLEEALKLQRSRIDSAKANPASGSGTPYLDAGGVVGAAVIAGAVFGGVAGAFFIRGRSGKYAAMGRG